MQSNMGDFTRQTTLTSYWDFNSPSPAFAGPSSPVGFGYADPPSISSLSPCGSPQSPLFSLSEVLPADSLPNGWLVRASKPDADDRSSELVHPYFNYFQPPTPIPRRTQTLPRRLAPLPMPELQDEGDDSAPQPDSVYLDHTDGASKDPGTVSHDEGEGPQPNLDCNVQDEVDGWLSSRLIKAVKTALLHLFNITCLNHQKANCYGCQVSHPSQLQHQCLEVIGEDYYHSHYASIIRQLLMPQLIPAIQALLANRGIQADDHKVKTVAETVLHELKCMQGFRSSIHDMYDEMDSEAHLDELETVSRRYGLEE